MYVCLVQYQRTGYNQQPAVVIVRQREKERVLCLKERRDWKADAFVRPSVRPLFFLPIHPPHFVVYLSIGQWRASHGSRCCSSWWWWWWWLLKRHWCWCWQRPFSHVTLLLLLDRHPRRLLVFLIMQVSTVTLKTNSAGNTRNCLPSRKSIDWLPFIWLMREWERESPQNWLFVRLFL